MSIVVCIKQVPTDISKCMYENGRIERLNGHYKINPLDLYALEAALRLKDRTNESVYVMTMGTLKGISALKECAAIGADELFLLSDSSFAGADTQATSYVLAKSIEKIENVRAVFCGQYSSDGSTGQVGPELAEKLQFNFVQNVIDLNFDGDKYIDYTRVTEYGIVEGRTSIPSLFTVNRLSGGCRIATIKGILESNNKRIRKWDRNDINADILRCGLRGSFTRVKKIFSIRELRNNSLEINGDTDDIAGLLLKEIENNNCKYKIKDTAIMLGAELKPTIEVVDIGDESSSIKSDALVFTEVYQDRIQDSALQLIGKIRSQMTEGNISVIVVSKTIPANLNSLFCYGVTKVLNIPMEIENLGNEEVFAKLLADIICRACPKVVLFSATEFGRAVAAMVASMLNVGLTADCTEIVYDEKNGILTQTRPVYGGKSKAEVISVNGMPQMATVRPNVFPAVQPRQKPIDNPMIAVLKGYKMKQSEKQEKLVKIRINRLDKATIVLIGGRGLNYRNNYIRLKKLAEKLNIDVGATRAVVDSGWASSEEQIGLTGINLMADLCILFGVSGAPEHISGLSNVKKIIAINIDPSAAIFDYSDMKIVSDVNIVLNALEMKLHLYNKVYEEEM